MKRRTAAILLGMAMTAFALGGCSQKQTAEATEAASESARTEEEGTGETELTSAADQKDSGETAENTTEADSAEASQKTENTEASDTSAESKDSSEASTSDAASSEETSAEKTSDSAGTESESTEENTGEENSESAEKVAVLFPNEEDWYIDAEEIQKALTDDGYEPVMLYAGDDASEQVSQIQEVIGDENPAVALVIAPVDAYGLTDVLADAKEAGIPVFSYDDLIMDTNAVKYYVTFGGRQIGQQIGQAIVEREELDKVQEAKESRTIEFFMGSQDDSQALFLYNGLMEILQPYLDDGTLVCKSEKTSFDDTGLLRWSAELAQTRALDTLTEFYADGSVPDIICTGFDAAAISVTEALKDSGVQPGSEDWPLITGVGCSADGVKSIASGEMTLSIFMDRRTMADQCEEILNVYLHGEDDPEVNDYEQYDNGVKIIGTYLCEPQLIDQENYEILIDNGYYEEEEVRPEPTATPVPTDTPVPTATPVPTDTPVPTETPEPTDTPVPTDTPEPTKTPDPEPTKAPEKTATSTSGRRTT